MRLMNLLGVGRANKSTNQRQAANRAALAIQQLCRDPRANKILTTGGYCKILNDICEWRTDAIIAATNLLASEMSFIPAGGLELQGFCVGKDPWEGGSTVRVAEDPFFIDRRLVTNAQFKHFLNEDAYRTESLWPAEVWQSVSQFIDSTGVPGPAGWEGGNYDPAKADHPVVGISQHEALAYANWVGKRLPTTTQWQRAGTWWRPRRMFPWGDRCERQRINTFSSGQHDTVAVEDTPAAATPHGVLQLVGNVWEWVETRISEIEYAGQLLELAEPIAELRGGAFDTYLASQSTCVFRSGQHPMNRANNVGFRCAASHELLAVVTSD